MSTKDGFELVCAIALFIVFLCLAAAFPPFGVAMAFVICGYRIGANARK